MKPRLRLPVFLAVILGSLVFYLPVSAGGGETTTPVHSTPPLSEESKDEYYRLLKLFVDALDQVERNYVKDSSRRELVEAAIEGMLSKLDQHTGYIPPDELERFRSGVESEFGGIGVELSVEKGPLTVISPLVGTPAYRAGLLSGDVITLIDGQTADGLSLDEAVKKLKGRLGTQVTLTVHRPDDPKPKTVTLTREIIRVETVLGYARKPDRSWDYVCDRDRGIGYVRITAFGRHTGDELRRTLEQLQCEKVTGLILDLRFNPGGLLPAAVEVADLFVAKGRIVSTQGRNVKEQVWDARLEGTFEGFTLAVLVNQYSASASEIVAACLQDHQRAVVVGQRTFGKGSVQNIIELEEGHSALKLTTAGYHRPSGKEIDRQPDAKESDEWGVQPNEGLEVRLSEVETRRLARAMQSRDSVRSSDPSEQTPERTKDPQFDKGIEYLRGEIGRQPKQVAAGADASPPTTRDR